MKLNLKKLVTLSFLISVGLNVFKYLLSHTAYLFENDALGVTIEYVSYYASKLLDFLAFLALATVAFVLFAYEGAKKALWHTAMISTARIFYALPYYYLIFFYDFGYDSLESLLMSLLASLVVIILTVLGAYVSVMIAISILKHREKTTRQDILAALPEIVREPSTNDFLSKANLPILVFALVRFCFGIISELVDTVTFFISYRADYTFAEIATMLVNYVLLFALLILGYLISSRVKNLIFSHLSDSEKQA